MNDSAQEVLIGGYYKVQRKLGKGSFGTLYQGINIKNKEMVAIKFERHKTYNPQLEYEYKLYKKFAGLQGYAKVYWYGVEGDFNVMVMDMLGPTLNDLFEFCEKKFCQKTICWIGS